MKAIVATGYGPPDVLQMTEVDTPMPGAHDLLVRVHATIVTAGDVRIRSSNCTRFGRRTVCAGASPMHHVGRFVRSDGRGDQE